MALKRSTALKEQTNNVQKGKKDVIKPEHKQVWRSRASQEST